MFLLVMCVICTLFGIVMIYSMTKNYGWAKYVVVQAFAMCLGIGAFVVLTVIDPDLIAANWKPLTIFNVVFILGLLIFGKGDEVGSRAWYRFFGIGVQPSEIVKVIFIVLMAKQMSKYKEQNRLNRFPNLIKLAMHFVLYFGLITVIPNDLGSALIFLAIFIVMLVCAGVTWYWMGLAAAAVAAFIPLAWNFILKDYQKNRILAPYIPDVVDPTGQGITWQTNLCKDALASGRWTGVGFGEGSFSQSSYNARHTDCIFASIGEELGMIAGIIIIILLTIIIIRCCVIGMRSGSNFGMLICFGVATALAFQTFINIGMCIGITPVIGITLPFFSYGGSSIVAMYAAVGLVSGVKYRPKPKQNFVQYPGVVEDVERPAARRPRTGRRPHVRTKKQA